MALFPKSTLERSNVFCNGLSVSLTLIGTIFQRSSSSRTSDRDVKNDRSGSSDRDVDDDVDDENSIDGNDDERGRRRDH